MYLLKEMFIPDKGSFVLRVPPYSVPMPGIIFVLDRYYETTLMNRVIEHLQVIEIDSRSMNAKDEYTRSMNVEGDGFETMYTSKNTGQQFELQFYSRNMRSLVTRSARKSGPAKRTSNLPWSKPMGLSEAEQRRRERIDNQRRIDAFTRSRTSTTARKSGPNKFKL